MVRDFQVKSLPKVDLHRHFEGALRVETLFEFYKKRHPKDRLSLRKFSQRLKADKRKKSLVEFISKLGTKYIRSLKLSKKEIERLAFEVVVDAVEDKVIYLELRVCPLAHERKDLSVDEFFKALVRGVKRASKKFKIKVRLIVSFKREDGVKKNLELVELLKRNMKVIVGVDLCGDEAKYLNEDYKKIFKLTRSLGFKTTIHAGEAAGWQSIESAVKVLKADRIGHGVNIFPEADRLVKLLKARGVGVEMCLQSNVLTGAVSNLKKHPINYWYDQGVLVSVNTDNPVTTDYSLSQEWRKLIKERGFTQGDFLIMQIQAIEMSFLDEKGKKKLFEKIGEMWFEDCKLKIDSKHLLALVYIVSLFKKYKVRWSLVGSMSLWFQGIRILVNDVDICVDKRDVKLVNELLKWFVVLKMEQKQNDYFKSIFGVFNIFGVKIDTMANFKVKNGEYKLSYDMDKANLKQIEFKGMKFWVFPKHYELLRHFLTNRKDKKKYAGRYLVNNTKSVELLLDFLKRKGMVNLIEKVSRWYEI